jgi:hypothetical protein
MKAALFPSRFRKAVQVLRSGKLKAVRPPRQEAAANATRRDQFRPPQRGGR